MQLVPGPNCESSTLQRGLESQNSATCRPWRSQELDEPLPPLPPAPRLSTKIPRALSEGWWKTARTNSGASGKEAAKDALSSAGGSQPGMSHQVCLSLVWDSA